MNSHKRDTDLPVLASLKTNGFVSNPLGSIAIATMMGMGLMFITIMMGAHIFISMIALFAGILLVYGYKVGKITYDLYADGIHMRIRKFIPYFLKKKEAERFIVWRSIRSFKNDIDQKRGGGEYEFLKLYLDQSPGEVWITDQLDKNGFQMFKIEFYEIVRKEHEASKKPSTSEDKMIGDVETTKSKHLVEKRSFYKSNAAKALTIFFILVAVGLAVNNQMQGLSFRNLFRLELIIIPGITYMVYRVFVKQEG